MDIHVNDKSQIFNPSILFVTAIQFSTKHGKKRYNYELYKIFNESNNDNHIKVKRLAWAGHLMRMNNDRTLKKIYLSPNQME
jgi:hypothetical protein